MKEQSQSMGSFQYPPLEIHVLSAEDELETLYDHPPWIDLNPWPPLQVKYLQVYLKGNRLQNHSRGEPLC